MFTIHHLNNSRSQRVLWLMEELQFTYQIKFYQRDEITMLAPADLKSVHPLGKSPILEHEGRKIAETGAIFDYLLHIYGKGPLNPSMDTSEGRSMNHWIHYAEGSAMPPLLMKLVFDRLPLNVNPLMRPLVRMVSNKAIKSYVTPQIANHVGYWSQALTKNQWFAGSEFTAADIMMSFPLEALTSRSPQAIPQVIQDFVAKIHARPAYQAALKKGGEYAYAKAQ
ncbi:glutathione S-transferase [Hirschia baltica]|uniref:glutathione transferase n=1 Tax=Hirschia baltica (strain ATCC 49814 / DSM 5838 / IFAM 1418) TaxID=582402 RepID=C6XIW1_HIRBI|nr:glutathione S-transferase [Hirschia baltica]ACT59056.1 Glutathione transferase [Hirschia baltica ATCC 49814]